MARLADSHPVIRRRVKISELPAGINLPDSLACVREEDFTLAVHRNTRAWVRQCGTGDPRQQGQCQMRHLSHAVAFVTYRARDRKSTRLNSSHTVISYAVFCLKKKTKKQ